MEIISKAHLKEMMKLKQKKYRESTSKVLVEGVRLIQQLIENNIPILELLTTTENIHKPKYPADKYFSMEEWQIQNLSSTKHPQEMMALISIKFPAIENNNFLLYLEDIQEPGNLGTIFRTALAAGVDGIVLSPDCCELTNPKVIRSSLGSVFSMPSKIETTEWLIKQDASIISTSSHQAQSIFDVLVPEENKILVLGSEAHGISQEVLDASKYKVKIPISNNIESLNVAAAAAISIYHFSHAR
jgi:RNA methyltransferase, TrmH family